MPTVTQTNVTALASCSGPRAPLCRGYQQVEVAAIRELCEWTCADMTATEPRTPIDKIVERSTIRFDFARDEDRECPHCGGPRTVTDQPRPEYAGISGKDPWQLVRMQAGIGQFDFKPPVMDEKTPAASSPLAALSPAQLGALSPEQLAAIAGSASGPVVDPVDAREPTQDNEEVEANITKQVNPGGAWAYEVTVDGQTTGGLATIKEAREVRDRGPLPKGVTQRGPNSYRARFKGQAKSFPTSAQAAAWRDEVMAGG